VRKTRRQLREALVSLILERGWDSVSVMDVCAKADVGRSTFYLHYADKEDLLVSGIDELHEALAGVNAKAAGTFGFLQPLFEHARDNRRLMQALAGRKSGQTVQRMFRDGAIQLVDTELVALGLGGEVRHHTARYLGGALGELLMSWLEAPRGMDAAGLAGLFQQLTSGVVSAAKGVSRR